jgi:cAMP-dependent protein kinase regulator
VESSEDGSDDDVDSLPIPIPKNNTQNRVSVSAESYGEWNKKAAFVPKFFKKNPGAVKRIETRLSQAFMFSALDDAEKKIVIDAMQEKHFK